MDSLETLKHQLFEAGQTLKRVMDDQNEDSDESNAEKLEEAELALDNVVTLVEDIVP